MKIKLYWYEVSRDDYEILSSKVKMDLLGVLGSSPRMEGQSVEGQIVPQGKVWLFPQGRDFKRIEQWIKGEQKSIIVDVQLC